MKIVKRLMIMVMLICLLSISGSALSHSSCPECGWFDFYAISERCDTSDLHWNEVTWRCSFCYYYELETTDYEFHSMQYLDNYTDKCTECPYVRHVPCGAGVCNGVFIDNVFQSKVLDSYQEDDFPPDEWNWILVESESNDLYDSPLTLRVRQFQVEISPQHQGYLYECTRTTVYRVINCWYRAYFCPTHERIYLVPELLSENDERDTVTAIRWAEHPL